MTTVAAHVRKLQVGEPLEHENLTLVPLAGGEADKRLDYILAAEAFEAGVLTVTEVSEGGAVPELLAVTKSETMILLLDGEELVGAKQNRVLNTTILLAPKSKTRIPVSCVEQGRWRYASPGFKSAGHSPPRTRARKSPDVSRSLRAHGRAAADQGAVWEDVAGHLAALDVHSPTMALHAAREQHADRLQAYFEAMRYPAGARGVFVAIRGRFAAMDLFDKAETLEKLWSRLVTAYAMDALAVRHRPAKAESSVSPQAVIEWVGQLSCDPCPSVGVGEDWRFGSDELVGQALVAEGVAVHLCVFPNPEQGLDADGRESGSRIHPPSRRRRGRGGGTVF